MNKVYNKIVWLAAIFFALWFAADVTLADTRTTIVCRNETTQVLVNVTKLEWCAGLYVTCYYSGNCYCNVTKLEAITHTTTVCEDVDGSKQTLQNNNGRKLGDPEVAAIAVICSLVFSILISLTVFLVQRQRCKNNPNPSTPVQIEIRDGMHEADTFFPPSSEERYLHVKPANHECSVHEVTAVSHDQEEGIPNKSRIRKISGEAEALMQLLTKSAASNLEEPGSLGKTRSSNAAPEAEALIKKRDIIHAEDDTSSQTSVYCDSQDNLRTSKV